MQLAPITTPVAAPPTQRNVPGLPRGYEGAGLTNTPMTLAALAPIAPDEVRWVATPQGVDIQRGSAVAAQNAPPTSPSGAVSIKYGTYLMGLPGLVMFSYKSSQPTVVRLLFNTPEFAALAKNTIKPEILGATFDFQSPPGMTLPPDSGNPFPWKWWELTSNIARTISGMRGVVNVDMGNMGITVWADNAAYRDVLKPLFTDRLPDGGYLGWYVWPHPPGGSRPPGTRPPIPPTNQ
jgi:hypothetical protein